VKMNPDDDDDDDYDADNDALAELMTAAAAL
jgi:hypothetical protein